MADPVPSGATGPAEDQQIKSGWGGCGLWAAAFLVVTIGGCAVGLSLRSDPNATQKPVTVEAGAGWTLQVYQDADKDPCTDLYGEPPQEGSDRPLLAGQCAYAAVKDPKETPQYKATSVKVDDLVVVFGPVPTNVKSVRLTLADGSHPVVRTGDKQGVHYFVHAGEADDQGPTILLDANGNKVTPPPATG